MEKSLVILKPCTIARMMAGEIISKFEKKGLVLIGVKMMQLSDELLAEHYAHLIDRDFYPLIKNSMQATPVVVTCWKGINAVHVVREMTGATVSRDAKQGTIRGDYSMSQQENVIHTSDSPEHALEEIGRFFKEEEIFDYQHPLHDFLYTSDEL